MNSLSLKLNSLNKTLYAIPTTCQTYQVTTLTANRGVKKPGDDEQLHVLPLYTLADTDENGDFERQQRKLETGAIEILSRLPTDVRRGSQSMPSETKHHQSLSRTSGINYNDAASLRRAYPPSFNETALPRYSREALGDTQHFCTTLENNARFIYHPAARRPPVTHLHPPLRPILHNFDSLGVSVNSARTPPSGHRQFFQDFCENKTIFNWSRTSGNEENFTEPAIGGVAIALEHGSVMFECAKRELHATTALRNPDRRRPTRLSLILYQHRNLNAPKHGAEAYRKRMERKSAKRQHHASTRQPAADANELFPTPRNMQYAEPRPYFPRALPINHAFPYVEHQLGNPQYPPI